MPRRDWGLRSPSAAHRDWVHARRWASRRDWGRAQRLASAPAPVHARPWAAHPDQVRARPREAPRDSGDLHGQAARSRAVRPLRAAVPGAAAQGEVRATRRGCRR